MARGTANGEQIVSQAGTPEYRAGHERTFGDRKPQRGQWVATPTGLVPADEYVPPAPKTGTGIMSGRCYEGNVAPDGTDISTRAKRKAWMRETGNADYSDYKGVREAKKKEREARARGEFKPDKQLREFIGRELYKRKMIT